MDIKDYYTQEDVADDPNLICDIDIDLLRQFIKIKSIALRHYVLTHDELQGLRRITKYNRDLKGFKILVGGTYKTHNTHFIEHRGLAEAIAKRPDALIEITKFFNTFADIPLQLVIYND